MEGECRGGRKEREEEGRDGRSLRHDLQHIPVLDDLAVVVQPENVDTRPGMVAWPVLPAVQDDKVAFGDSADEIDALVGELTSCVLKVIDKGLLAIAHARIVLDVFCTNVALDGVTRTRLIEHQINAFVRGLARRGRR